MKISKYLRWLGFYFSQNPFYVIFYVTARCNARCSHCFYWRFVESAPARKEMTLEEIETIAKKWGKMLIVNLTGGEAYLRDDLIDIVRAFVKYTGAEIIAIPSNGLLTEKIVKTIKQLLAEFPRVYFRFSFSLDGLGKVHDDIRGVPGAFEKVVETISLVKALKKDYRNFSVMTNSCFMQANQDSILDTLKFIKSNLNVDAISATYIRGDARLDENKKNLYQNKYLEVIEYLSNLDRDKFKSHPMSGFIFKATNFARFKVFENLKIGKRNFECYAINKMIVVEDDANVRICEMLPTSLGNLRDFDYDIKKMITTDKAKEEIKKIKNHECNCTWECAIRTGIIYNPREIFPLLKWILSKKLE
ncbi:MAG: radical SAM protein [Patescibacteria group bacterium]